MKAVSLAASLLVMCIGAVVLTGWILDIEVLKSVLPALVATKPNTAIGLLLSGVALAAAAWKEPGKAVRILIAILAVAVAAIGALTLSEYFFGWDLGIDQRLFRDALNTVWTSLPGRMAPISAFCFVLIGGALLAASQPIPARLRIPVLAGLGAALSVMGGLALLGCIAEAWLHAPSWNASGLSLQSALAFLLLGCALLALAAGRNGLSWSLDGVVTTGFAIAVAIMLLAAGVSYNFTDQLRDTAGWVSHRQEVLKELGNAAAGMANLESAERGYIILGDVRLLARTGTSAPVIDMAEADAAETDARQESTQKAVRANLGNLRTLTADNPTQQRRLDELDKLIPQRLDFFDRAITIRRHQGFPAAEKLIAGGTGFYVSDAIKRLFKEMQEVEYALLDKDQVRSRTASMSTFLVLPLGVFLSLTISSLGLFFLNTGVGERIRIEKAWRESEERYQTVIENMAEGLVIASLDGQLLHWNPAALAVHGFSSDEDWCRQLPDFVRIFELSALDGSVLPLEQWPISRVIHGERLRDFSVRIRRVDKDWERVFSYSGGIIREAGGRELAFVTMFDITERTHSEEAVRASEKQLRSFVEQAPVAIAMFDRNMVYLAASRRWVADYGGERADLLGMCHYDVVPDIPDGWKDVHRQGLAGIPYRSDEEMWIREDGSQYWMQKAVQPWQDAHGAVGGIMILSENITDRKQAEQIRLENARLEDENRRFAEASRLKSEFLANMSHELRTPLNGIIGFTELMSDERPGPLNRKQKEYLGDVLNSANHLLQLINDVLDLAKVEAGKFDFQPVRFVPAQAIEEVCAIVKGLAKQKEIRLTSEAAPGLDFVTLDERRFKQICFNLLSNAVKFTDPGGSVEIVALARDAGHFEVRVTDTGIGIKPQDIDRLFQEFEQLESGAARRFQGTGLGLALTKKLAELQGGSIAVQSEYGKGSTFTVVLPREAKEIVETPASIIANPPAT